MKNRIKETIRVTCLFLKKTNWLSVFCLSFLWAVGAFLLYDNYLNADLEENFHVFFSPNAISLVHAIVYYLSFGLPVVFTIACLQYVLCEEFYYTRTRNRSSVAWAKILTVAGCNGASVCTMVVALSVLHCCKFRDSGIFPEFLFVLREFALLLVPRIVLSLFFLLTDLMRWNLILEFSVMTAMIIGSVFSPVGQVFLGNEPRIRIFGLIVIFVIMIFCIDAKRDISLEEGRKKNDE